MKTLTRSLTLGGALVFAVSTVSLAESPGWSEGQHILEQHLQPGKTPADYRQILKDMGYTITSTNYDTPDYVEYEIVKGDRTYEVQIDVDDETGNATDVEVEANLWKTNPTASRRNVVRSRADRSLMSRPPTTTRPSDAPRRPPAIDSSVVFPDPDGPTSATISSSSTVSVA